ncbi:MAG: hypothetical protein ACOY3X_11895 [Pseudomonadota bacterium]
MKKSVISLFVLSVFLSGQAWSALVTISNVQLESFNAVANGDFWFEVKVAPGTTLSTGCTATDTNRVLGRSIASNYGPLELLQGQAAYADAQGRNVDLIYDNTVCNATYGRSLMGIRVLPAP